MRKKLLHSLLLLLLGMSCLTSCIQEEALNSECDITGVDSLWLRSVQQQYPGFLSGKPRVNYGDSIILFSINDEAPLSSLAPRFNISQGATLYFGDYAAKRLFDPNEMHDFTTPKSYTVVSEDQMWHRTYTVKFVKPDISGDTSSACDIKSVDAVWYTLIQFTYPSLFVANPVVSDNRVTFSVSDPSMCTQMNPLFVISDGASLYFNEGGTLIPYHPYINLDFSTGPKIYTVVAANGVQQKDYTVEFVKDATPPTDVTRFFSEGFENITTDSRGQYQRLQHESLGDLCWDNGNAGYALTGMAATPLDYPTTFVKDATSLSNNYARLRTMSTGTMGSLAGMPIAAGNLFIGEFDTSTAMLYPLKATRFGLASLVLGEPVSVSGYFKYTPGSVFTDQSGNTVSEKTDQCDIYAVLYEIDATNFEPLDGSNVKTSDRVVAIAEMPAYSTATVWTSFDLPFVWRDGKQFDKSRYDAGGYAFTLVMTSSKEGAEFSGAVGSELHVDNVKVKWKVAKE